MEAQILGFMKDSIEKSTSPNFVFSAIFEKQKLLGYDLQHTFLRKNLVHYPSGP